MKSVDFTVKENEDTTTKTNNILVEKKELCCIIDGIYHLSISFHNFQIVYNKNKKKVMEVIDYNKMKEE